MTAIFDHIALWSRASWCMLVENLFHNSHKLKPDTWMKVQEGSSICVPKGSTFRKWQCLLPPQHLNSKLYDVFDGTAKHLEQIPDSLHPRNCSTVLVVIVICRHMYNHLKEYPDEIGRIIFTLFDETLCEVFFLDFDYLRKNINICISKILEYCCLLGIDIKMC
ncbi:hypothetical protein LIER_36472 [Lithospermum erythrorhizon]|uniref:Uncharacterized protein n=1 Tax=Lithospermum erythrorhizon TaxID=34254 RepID=A0AAV3P886_LITER